MGYSRLSIAFKRVDLPQPFSPRRPYRRPYVSSRVVSVMRTRPWNTSEAAVILTSLLCLRELSTPVVTRSERPCLSIWSANFLTVSKSCADVAGWSSSGRSPSASSVGGVFAPDALLEPALEREAAVFLGALPSAALLASRAAFDAETMVRWRRWKMVGVYVVAVMVENGGFHLQRDGWWGEICSGVFMGR